MQPGLGKVYARRPNVRFGSKADISSPGARRPVERPLSARSGDMGLPFALHPPWP